MAAIPWRGIVVDEAHRLKGVSSKLLEALHAIMPLGVQLHGTQHRLLMTGTPLQVTHPSRRRASVETI